MPKDLKIYKPDIIETEKNSIKHKNAFILPNGNFILAKGYTGCNPSHQLESSALQICRNLTNQDLQTEYESHIQKNSLFKHYYLRTMLVHYYGMTLFARIEIIKSFKDRNKFFDYSLVPNPKYHKKEVTFEQILTLEKLFQANDDETLLTNDRDKETSKEILKKVLNHQKRYDNWHREF